jgi:hypothetical protein
MRLRAQMEAGARICRLFRGESGQGDERNLCFLVAVRSRLKGCAALEWRRMPCAQRWRVGKRWPLPHGGNGGTITLGARSSVEEVIGTRLVSRSEASLVLLEGEP